MLLLLAIIGLFIHHRLELWQAIKRLEFTWVFAGLICFGINYFSRATRLRLLVDNKMAIWPTAFYCASFHGFATYILPMRTGDFSLPFILKTVVDVNPRVGLSVLYRARLLDIFTLGVWLIAACGISSTPLAMPLRWKMALAGIAMILLPIFIRKLANIQWRTQNRFQTAIKAISASSRLRKNDILSSFAIWIAIGMGLWCVAEAMGLNISFAEMILLIAVQLIMQLVPVQGMANSGNHEGGWVLALTLLGYSVQSAVEFALISHLVILIYILILGTISIFIRPLVPIKMDS
jgi:uncharacterized membrane protein YbhN (UPF0104 family)